VAQAESDLFSCSSAETDAMTILRQSALLISIE
jgi:hypothetical protein